MEVITRNCYDSNDFYRLLDNSWGGALDTLRDIEKADKEEEFMDLLEEYFADEVEDTELNDFIWFEREEIYDRLGLDSNGDLIDAED